jgi:hypothetical protein
MLILMSKKFRDQKKMFILLFVISTEIEQKVIIYIQNSHIHSIKHH